MNNGRSVSGFGESVAAAPDLRRTIPFEYAFRYKLEGQPGLVQNNTIDISIEGAFTAVSIGYGVVPTVPPITFGLPADADVGDLFEITFSDLLSALSRALGELGESDPIARPIGPSTATVLKDGFKLNPQFADLILFSQNLPNNVLSAIFQVVGAPPERVVFKYALFDDGSGREFQSEPILNIAGLGSSDGKRPFRYLARPVEFAPRSTIRLQITELSAFKCELHISLQGYKTLGTPSAPTDARLSRRTRRIRR
jgi:hypothetical protein